MPSSNSYWKVRAGLTEKLVQPTITMKERVVTETDTNIHMRHRDLLDFLNEFDRGPENTDIQELVENPLYRRSILGRDQRQDNILHLAAREPSNLPRVRVFSWFAIRHPELLTQYNAEGKTPLDIAAALSPECLLYLLNMCCVLDRLFGIDDPTGLSLDKFLKEHCDAGGVSQLCKLNWTQILGDPAASQVPGKPEVDSMEKAEILGFIQEHKNLSTCVHDAWVMKECGLDSLKKFRETMRDAVKQHGKDGCSCLHHFLRSRSSVTEDSEPQLDDKTTTDIVKNLLYVGGNEILNGKYRGKFPVRLAVDNLGLPFQAVEMLATRFPEAVFQTSQVDTDTISSPYVALTSKTSAVSEAEMGNPQNSNHDMYKNRKEQIIGLFKYLCIKKHVNCLDTAEMHLYGSRKDGAPGQYPQAPKLFFDTLAECQVRVDRSYMANLHNMGVRFDSVLAHVSLPKWDPSRRSNGTAPEVIGNPEVPTGVESPSYPDLRTPGWGPYQEVFDWLRESGGVNRILKVTVDDLGDMPHSDQAIVDSLEKLEVEIFDWRKTDISIETVQKAAPSVEELYLYSSGRQPALIGWSCKHALVRLKKLKRIHVIFQPGPESPEVLQKYFQEFLDRTTKHCPQLSSNIFPQYPPPHLQGGGAQPSQDLEQSRGRTSSWILSAREFSGYVSGLPRKLKIPKPTVKIAIIDDGIQLGDPKIKVVGGRSFWRTGPDGEFKDFWVDPGTHGIEMAHYITEACPMAHLVIARVSSRPGRDGRLCPEANSVASAICWAAEQDVDIMSISLTIRKTATNFDQIEAITSAIRGAYYKNIIIFCSVSDERPEHDDQVYPAALKTKVIPIGAATAEGHAHTTVDEKAAKFLLQGVQVPSSSGGGEMTTSVSTTSSQSKLLTGSSIATALAAGLGGLLLYLDRMVYACSAQARSQARDTSAFSYNAYGGINNGNFGFSEGGGVCLAQLQRMDMEAMTRVLQKLCPAIEDKYLIVWNKLKISDKQDSRRAMEGLKGIMNSLKEEGR